MEEEIKHISGSAGGFLVGRSHKNNGIKAINKSTGLPLEMEGGEVVITKPAVEDQELREFEGEMLTNRQILSKINESGGGVSFALGGDIPTELYFTGNSYKYGGDTLTDYEIAHKISSCGCKHKTDGLSEGKSIEDIAAMHNVSVSQIENQLQKGIQVEAEHTSDIQDQTRIAMDHLVENPNYYDILANAHLEKGGELESKFLRIEKLILKELKNRGLEKEYRITSKSKTDYGESWYIKFENELEIRISDHSVQSMFRVFDEKYVDFINVYSTYEPEMAVFTIDKYVEKSKEIKNKNQKIKEAENRLQERIDYITEKSKTFLNDLKNKNKGVFFHGFTRIGPSDFSIKYPNSELIFPISVNGGYEYYYVGKNSNYSMKGLHPKYFNFLVEKGIIEAEKVEEKILYANGGNLKKATENDDLDNVTQVSDEVLDGPDILASEGGYFEKGGEIQETLNSFPTDAEELKKSLLHVMEKLEGNKQLLSNIQATYFENIVAENPKKELTAYYEAIQVIPENKREYFEHTFSDSKYNELNIVEKLDDNPYNYLPEVLLPKTKIRKVDFSPTPDSVNLAKITELFVNRDPLRPIMSGVYFNLEDERIEATNAHILLFIKEKPHVSKSCICLMGKTKEWYMKNFENKPTENQDGCWEIEGNYMRTSAVVPNEFEFVVTVDAQKLLDYAKASQYFIKYGPIRISFATEDGIQTRLVNAAYLENSLKAMLMLGYDEVDFCMMLGKNKPIAIVPKGNSRKISYAGINTDLVLTMPFIDEGAKETDFVYDVDNNKATLYYKTKLVKTEPEVFEDSVETEEEEVEIKELPKEILKETKTDSSAGVATTEKTRGAESVVLETQNDNEEIKDTISGLEVLLPSLRGKEKTEAKDTITALYLLMGKDYETEQKISDLKEKLSVLKDKLHDAKVESNQKFSNLGWGAGMRKSKLNVSTKKEDSIQERINKIEAELKELQTSSFEKGGPILLAPNGKPSNLDAEMYYLVRTPQFKEWFGDWEKTPETASKVVDENGEPLVVYHRSKTKIEVFDTSKQLDGWLGKGFYFSESKNEFKSYGNKLLSTFLSIKKPFIVLGNSPSDFLSELKEKTNTEGFNTTKELKANHYDGVIYRHWDYEGKMFSCFEPNQIKLADGINTTFDSKTNNIRYEKGGILTDDEKNELYQEWNDLVNMSSSELQKYYDSEEGKSSGLSAAEAKKLSIKSGRESARWIIKMKETPVSEWTSEMWQWAKRQVSFIKRMKGVKGDLYDDKNQKTRKHKALLIWGHNPEKYAKGGVINKEYNLQFKPIETPLN